MAFKINELAETSQWVQTEERLWLTADRGKLVAEGDPEAAFLFATPSDRISVADAERYGLLKGKGSAKAAAGEDESAAKKRSAKKS